MANFIILYIAMQLLALVEEPLYQNKIKFKVAICFENKLV